MTRTTTPFAITGVSADALSSLFQAIGGLRNRSALMALAGCLAAGVLATGAVQSLFGRFGLFSALLSMALLFVASSTGVNAAGVLLMDQARGRAPRPLGEALRFGLPCLPKVLALAVAAFLIALTLFIGIALLFVVCKIPLLGTLLFTLAFPLAVLAAGLTLSGLWLCLFLVLPAIWQGTTVTRALAQALAIVRNRLVESFLMLAVVGLLCACVGAIVFGVLFVGLAPSLSLSVAILGGGGMAALGLGPVAMSGPYGISGGTGLGLLWALAAALVSQVWLLGLNLVYLRVSEGLDADAAEQVLSEGFDEARRRASEVGQKAREAAERAREQARRHTTGSTGASSSTSPPTAGQPPAPVPAPAPTTMATDASTSAPPAPPASPPAAADHATTAGTTAAASGHAAPAEPASASATPVEPTAATELTCPQCAGTISRNDVFCGACGHRLKPPARS